MAYASISRTYAKHAIPGRSRAGRRSVVRNVVLGAAALSLFGLFVGASGCQSIAGIEERSLDELATSCQEYCSLMMANCTEDNAMYLTDEMCMKTCLALPLGSFTERVGNTVSCRLNRAERTEREPDVECRLAGPGGGGGPCGTDCEAWCTLLEQVCGEQFAEVGEDCPATCELVLTSQPDLHLERDYTGDTLQCRLVHTMVALVEEPAVHCTHSGLIPQAMCVGGADEEPTCAAMCQTVRAACQGENAVFEDDEQCLQACEVFELGTAQDTAHATVGCRIYHALTALTPGGAPVHCPHAGPTGEGQCGTDRDAISTGNCHNYCLLLESACGEHEGWTFADRGDCEESCGTELANKGAKAMVPGYSVATAGSGDTLHCRALHAVRALQDPLHCDAAFGAAPCQ